MRNGEKMIKFGIIGIQTSFIMEIVHFVTNVRQDQKEKSVCMGVNLK